MRTTVKLKIPRPLEELLRCPACGSPLTLRAEDLQCAAAACARVFPVVGGVPVLLDEEASVFSIAEVVASSRARPGHGRIGRIIRALVPPLGRNVKARRNYRTFSALLAADARVLVIGSGIEPGNGMEGLAPSLQLVQADIRSSGNVKVACDAHGLPFAAESFDGVIMQAVLEHVVDPRRCVEEAYRVLKPGGVVYAETPFMQQVHAGRYDFTRFTHLGHRRLFRRFAEIDSGACCGPGMALAWSWRYFLQSFAGSHRARLTMRAMASFTSFFLTWFDYWLVDRPGALDAASAVYFLGRKSDTVLSDRELMGLYRGVDHAEVT